mmetsp:Transcript_362/g.591  ORF Transcript_362/g.591 Transcript_362/m.591 type:complete len:171 (-) Transcript_362:100-612(-)
MVVTIVNRSEILGHPLAVMLSNDGATVYSIDIDSILVFSPNTTTTTNTATTTTDETKNTNNNTSKHHDTMSGSNGMIQQLGNTNAEMERCIQNSSVIVTAVPLDTYRIPSDWIQPYSIVLNVASEPNVEEEEVRKIEGVTYVPHIGKVTVSVLEHNLMLLHKRYFVSKQK